MISNLFSRHAKAGGAFAFFCFSCLLSSHATAGWGPLAPGNGPDGLSLAGADVALLNDATVFSVNPATLTDIKGETFTAYGAVYKFGNQKHKDSLGNRHYPSKDLLPVFGGAYAKALDDDSRVVVSFGGVAQGGVGYIYKGLTTEAGNQDRLSTEFGVFRVGPAIGWKASERLSLGAVLNVNYAEIEQHILPNTSIAANGDDPGFSGFALTGLSGFSYSFKVAANYQLTPKLRLSAVFANETPLTLKGGDAELNFSAQGLGKVKYDRAELAGLSFAREFNLGLKYEISQKLELGVRLGWLDWSESFKRTQMRLGRASNPDAPQQLNASAPLDWQDQFPLAVALRYQYSPRLTYTVAMSFVNDPIPKKTLEPTTALIATAHIGGGLAYRLDEQWEILGSVIHILPNSKSYSTNGLPLGKHSTERMNFFGAEFGIRRRF